MMKKRVLLIALLCALVAGCTFSGLDFNGEKGSGVTKSEKRELPAFTELETNGPFDIQISCGQPQSFEISGDDNLLPLIKTEVDGNRLKIKTERGLSPKTPLKLVIALKNIEKIDTSGITRIKLKNVDNDRLALEASGAGKLDADGKTKDLKLSLSGAGQMDLSELKAVKADVNCSGAGQISLFASEELKADLSGAGKITYYGNPKTVTPHVSGVGNISKGD
jgi:hypothetical protein